VAGQILPPHPDGFFNLSVKHGGNPVIPKSLVNEP
jgi:hypothetical protein